MKLFEGQMSPSTVKMICPGNEDDVSSGTGCDNCCDDIALEKEVDHHENSDDESHYDYEDENSSDSGLSESEGNSDDDNQ